MYSIGQLSKRSGLSRSTLLYYDRKGLVSPSARSVANYRLYDDNDVARLDLILIYKQTGISLEDIKDLLDHKENKSTQILEQRLENLNREVADLRSQQQFIIKLLQKDSLLAKSRVLTKEKWVEILKACGMSEVDMRQWHIEFERTMPQGHQSFLESLGIELDEIEVIRAWSKRS